MYKAKPVVLRSLSPQNKSLSPPQNSKYSVLQQSKQNFDNMSPDRYKSLHMTSSLQRFPSRFPLSNHHIRSTLSGQQNSTRQFSNSPKMSPKISPNISPKISPRVNNSDRNLFIHHESLSYQIIFQEV